MEPLRVHGYHPRLSTGLWPGVYHPDWDTRFDARYGYNPAKAKALLEQAGYPDGFEFTLYLYTLPGLPEIPDIGQAMAQDFKAIGLKPKLVEMEIPRVRALYLTKAAHGAVWALHHGFSPLDTIRVFNRAKGGSANAYEHPFIEERWATLGQTVDPAARARILKEIGEHKFNEVAEMPMFWLFADVAINPKFIAEYVFTGAITGYYTHLEYIKLAP